VRGKKNTMKRTRGRPEKMNWGGRFGVRKMVKGRKSDLAKVGAGVSCCCEKRGGRKKRQIV